MTLGNTATVTLAFDAASRITGVRNAKSDGTEIAAYAYTRDNVGNPTAVALTGGDLLTFSYDTNYRLTREQRSGANAYDVTYTFDQVGNRTAKIASGSTTTYTFNAMDQLTTEQAPAGALTTYSFDPAGNNTVVNADGTFTTYTWDLANRMTGAALPAGGTVTLVYDATGLRRSREDASGLVRFVWDGQNVLQETDSGGTTQAQYTTAVGSYGPILSQRRSGVSAFYHADALGTINRLTDASQAVTDSYVLDAWGQPVASSGSTTNPHRYVGTLGYYTDPDLGLDYVRARWLRPATGSWVSVDPVEGEARYGYVGGRVTAWLDPSGTQGAGSVMDCAEVGNRCLNEVLDWSEWVYSDCGTQGAAMSGMAGFIGILVFPVEAIVAGLVGGAVIGAGASFGFGAAMGDIAAQAIATLQSFCGRLQAACEACCYPAEATLCDQAVVVGQPVPTCPGAGGSPSTSDHARGPCRSALWGAEQVGDTYEDCHIGHLPHQFQEMLDSVRTRCS